MTDPTRWRAHCLAERKEAIERVRVLDAFVDAAIAGARLWRALLLARARRYERLADATGGVARPVEDRAPWWAGGAP